jgi:hypothetical protein
METTQQPGPAVDALVLDTRPILDRGETPCGAIEGALRRLRKGQSLVILVPFEPVPLYAKLGNLGYEPHPEQLEARLWRVEFRPLSEAVTTAFEIPPCACSGAMD